MSKTMPLVEARDALGQRVDAAHYGDETTVITKNGQPRAVLVSYEWYCRRGAATQDHGADVGQTPADGPSAPLRERVDETPSELA